MSRSVVSIIVFFLLLIFFINGFSTSFSSHDISNLAYVLALGVDIGENAKIKVSAQFSTPDSSSPQGGSSEISGKIVLVSGEADTLFNALNLINSYIGKELNLSHCNLIVFSEDFAKQGISTQIYSFINNEEIRPSTNVLISKCSAYDYLDNVKPNLETITAQYYDTFSISNRFTGYFENITIGDFYDKLSSKATSPIAILGGLDVTAREKIKSDSDSSSDNSKSSSSSNNSNSKSSEKSNSDNTSPKVNSSSKKDIITSPEDLIAGSSSIEGKLGAENIGIAVFDGGKLCGELTAIETICHLFVCNSIDSCVIAIDNPFREDEKAELNLSPKKDSKVSVEIKDDIPHISVELSLEAYGLTLDEGINYETHSSVDMLSKNAKNYMEEQLNNYFKKTSKQYGTDIDAFAVKALHNFDTIQDWREYNWPEKYKNAEFNISVNINVISSLLITKT